MYITLSCSLYLYVTTLFDLSLTLQINGQIRRQNEGRERNIMKERERERQ